MNRFAQSIGLVLLASCIGYTAAGDRYHSDSGRWSDVRETFYVEARVISAEPMYETHWYYRSRGDAHQGGYEERCRVRDVEVYRSSSSSAGPAGAIIGGAIGAHVGSNAGHTSESTIVGAIAGGVIGGIIGSEIDRDNTTVHYRQERECNREYRYERRTLIGYEVRYRYNGREFRILTDEHPGRYVQLRVEVEPTVR